MDIDLPGPPASIPEASAWPEPMYGEAVTLTMQGALSRRAVGRMAGTVGPIRTRDHGCGAERAAIAPADTSALTFTLS